MPGETSPTSSRSSVPPLAASNRPGRSWVAPVNAPRACPKSSLSRSVSVMAPQLTAMNGPAARVDSSWTSRAIRSLPEPLSPVMRTVESTLATRRARSTSCRIARALGDDPQRLLDVARHADQRPAVLAELPLGRLQRLRDPVERDVEALLEAARLEEAQLLGALVAPLLARAPEEVAGRIALAHAAVLEDVDLLARAPAEVAAGEAADGPAHRAHRSDRSAGDAAPPRRRRRASTPSLESGPVALRLDAEEALEGVDAGAARGASPRRCPT